jgi:hypothetical protein
MNRGDLLWCDVFNSHVRFIKPHPTESMLAIVRLQGDRVLMTAHASSLWRLDKECLLDDIKGAKRSIAVARSLLKEIRKYKNHQVKI